MKTMKILNPQAFYSLYEDMSFPKTCEVIKIEILRDDPRVVINFMIKEIPSKKPKRWPSKFDAVYIELRFLGVADLAIKRESLQSSSCNIFSEIKVDPDKNFFKITYSDGGAIDFFYDWIQFGNITPGLLGEH